METKGLSGNQVVSVPLHRHEVSLDYVQTEVEIEYGLSDVWAIALRVPYEVKNQDSRITLIDPATPEQRRAMVDNMNIHHRDETYRGLSDLMVLLGRSRQGLFRDGDLFRVSFGATLPVGKTEEDPYDLGDRGLQHLHIQFGTGTFDPLLEMNYRSPLPKGFLLDGFLMSRLPLYENSHTYRGSREVTTGLMLSHSLGRRVMLHGNSTLYYQDFAAWAGRRDLNTGLLATSLMAGATLSLRPGLLVESHLHFPVAQRALSAGDTFEQGLTVLFRIGWR